MEKTKSHSHKDHLGRGINCRIPKNTWLNALDTCSGGKLIAQDKMIIEVTPFVATHEEAVDETDQSTRGVEFGMSIKPHECASLSGDLKVKRYTYNMIRHREMLKVTKVARIASIERKKYEQDLCDFIIKSIEENQEEQIDLGKQLTNQNSKDRLTEYLSDAKKSKDDSSLSRTWRTVADACSSFLDEKECTHYVSCIKLGAKQHEATELKKHGTNVEGGAGVSACEVASCFTQVQYQKGSERNVFIKDERGVISESSGTVTTEEVIEATLTPLFELIDESSELRVIMQALLCCHGSTGKQDYNLNA
jgi:hypothetical protein